MIISKGSGCDDDRSFDDYDILAEPLARPEDRVFRRSADRPGTTYASHSVKLGRHKKGGLRGGYAILVRHGGGTEIIDIPMIYDDGTAINGILAMPEQSLYGILYAMFDAVKSADKVGRDETRREWQTAFVNNQIRKTRRDRNNMCRVFIEHAPIQQKLQDRPVTAGPLL